MAENEQKRAIQPPEPLPVLPLRETVIYPMMVAPIVVGQERSVRLVKDVIASSRLAVLVTQRSTERRPAEPQDLYRVGTMAAISELTLVQDNTLRIAVHGLERVRILDYARTDPYLIARIHRAPEIEERGLGVEALTRTVRDLFIQLVGLVAEMSDELATAVQTIGEPRQLAYLVASSMPLLTAARQEILELDPVSEKLRRLIDLLQYEVAVRKLMQKITAETSAEMSKAQRDHILRAQMEAIQRELGEREGREETETRELRQRFEEVPLSEEARKEASRELDRLSRTPAASPEHSIIRTYLDWLLKLPWGKRTSGSIDVARARAVLDEDHYDLDKIKDRILDYLSVKRLREERSAELAPAAQDERARGEPILCLLGPPGVGKTSLGQSIARAMNRKFARISLGGIHDEAEIRGHRRTYIGAMPGRILQTVARAEAADPVFMLDEVDKLGVGFHGDPAAALLEVLDPAQNHAFVDSYLGVAFDLSRVLFICTANTVETIPPPLLDRMEVVALSGYTDTDKLHIARRYLIPKQIAAHGLREGEVEVTEGAILRVLREYTREAGVRGLERELSTILRKAARRVSEGGAASSASGAQTPIRVEAAAVPEYLGPQRFFDEIAERIDRPGVATGLAWTPTGGELLFVEATMMPGEEDRLLLTGMLGNVMRESAQAALSYLRSNAGRLGIDPRVFEHKTVHIHVPAGAIPKDGPSAGVTLLVALASQASGRPVRNDVAMTGEITLRGKVLPVGGIKEKVLAAHRAGIRTVILPRRNEGALEDVPEGARAALQIELISSVDEALSATLAPLLDSDADQSTAERRPHLETSGERHAA
jgi:ATP-dependent Lon protease